ncbi:MAG: DNA repair ATPase [Rhodocyclaceae bacterium]|nr:DNA repair ATPase [Rhodocyclaceae bacterium]
MTQAETDSTQVEAAVAAGGSYELLRKRLQQQGEVLAGKIKQLNEARLTAFGRSDLKLQARLRARTENNCVARDIVRVGDTLVFGYNVFMGLRKDIQAADVFSLYRLNEAAGSEELEAVPLEGSFLADSRFEMDFRELYSYYKQASLTQLRINQHKLLAAFQIGQQLTDLRVFRWSIELDGSLKYIDNRGERDIALPAAHDFEWLPTRREDHITGRHPHINILNTIFVETVGGDLTVKIENNTESGLGIYAEPVVDKNQSLADAEIYYVRLGSLILLKIKPYREPDYRYLVYNHRTQQVVRIDAIGPSCVQLPEDHGIIFPGGYYLQAGEHKRFDLPPDATMGNTGLRFKRMQRSPNGEDVLYVFYQPGGGQYALFTYNLIEKRLGTPVFSHGYARYDDGRMLVFQSDADEPTRLHPMQLWQTPFVSDDHAERNVDRASFFGRIGNAELVRGIAESMEITRAVGEQAPTRVVYEDLLRLCSRILDGYFWLASDEAGHADADLKAIAGTARAALDEFDKVAAIRREAARLLAQAEGEQHKLLTDIAAKLWQHPDEFVAMLDRLRMERGRLLALREQRYIDLPRIDAIDQQLASEQLRIGEKTLAFLLTDKAFQPYLSALVATSAAIGTATTTTQLDEQGKALEHTAHALDLLNELVANLPSGDATARTGILEQISSTYAETNRLRAEVRNRRKHLASVELSAEFGAQFKLFAQSVESALERVDTPEQCDDAMTRLLAQLEELEGRFGEQEGFAADLSEKREAVYEALTARKQQLLETRQRRAQTLMDSAQRIIAGIPRRVQQFKELAEVHGYFAGDPLLAKCRSVCDELRKIGAQLQADDLDTRLKTARDQAIRAVRDRAELTGEDGNTIHLGRHAFTVGHQALDLTLVPGEQGLAYHLTGTDYLVPLQHEEAQALKPFWTMALVSESATLYRAEYLAGEILHACQRGEYETTLDTLQTLCSADTQEGLLALVREFSAARYQEGYQKGVHDHDTAAILTALLPMQAQASRLAFSPRARVLAALFWLQGAPMIERPRLQRQAASAGQIYQLFGAANVRQALITRWAPDIARIAEREHLLKLWAAGPELSEEAAAYLVDELASDGAWIASGAALDLADAFVRHLERQGQLARWRDSLADCTPLDAWHLARDWVGSYQQAHAPTEAAWSDEAAATLVLDLPRQRHNADLACTVAGLRGEHPRIENGQLALNLNDFHGRLRQHANGIVPQFRRWQALRQQVLASEKAQLHLDQFQAKPLSSFVRNRLIDEVYLPLVGDNLAKQIGAAGDAKRTDRMGMLLLISPPGYGKTTLMEYIADRLGLIFVRINCPALGHDVVSLDPTQAPHSGARQELEKLNLGLAMGNNVMLYLDDIQHTNPEFLQKFIALCDGTRRIEGVWQGAPRTYDMRGKRFAVVMAGNPYTESGEAFKIPDMLANRADIYNLGDVLSGKEASFALSYIENSLTANPALMPLATRDPKDIERLVKLAQGEDIPASAFAHSYSSAELTELTGIMQRLFKVRDVLLRVNQAYILSAAQDDDYRVEPPFKLQGSYRNMAKLAVKVTAIMEPAELDALLRDHYRGEAQTLTTGAEENLLKLAQLIGTPTKEEQARWTTITEGYRRLKKLGGSESDGATRVANLLADIGMTLDGLRTQLASPLPGTPDWARELGALRDMIAALQPSIRVDVAESPAIAATMRSLSETYEKGIAPLVTAAYHKLKMDHDIWERVQAMGKEMKQLIEMTDMPHAKTAPRTRKAAGSGEAGKA